jgi:protein SCO1/2
MMYAALSNHETAKPRNHEKEFGLLFRVFGFRVFVACVVAFLGCSPAAAQMTGAPTAGYKREVVMTASTTPAPLREIGFDQYIGETIPLDIVFNDESGRRLMLGDYFGKRPVVLVFAYYDCPMLCTQVINGLSTALNVLSLEPHADFEIVTVSFNPKDTPATASAKKAIYLERYRHPGAAAGWHFLSGDQASIDRLTKAAGFRFVWDDKTNQFAHPTGVIVLTPEGRLARYLFGIEYGPRDLRYALVEASAGKVGNAVDALLLYCYHYDPMTGRYGLVVMRALRIAGIATVLALGTFIVVMVRREQRRSVLDTREAFDSSADRAARLRQGYGGSAVAGADKAARAEAQGPARSE